MGVSMELAVCQLLLGNVEAAESRLGLSPASATGPDAAVQQFIEVSPPPC